MLNEKKDKKCFTFEIKSDPVIGNAGFSMIR